MTRQQMQQNACESIVNNWFNSKAVSPLFNQAVGSWPHQMLTTRYLAKTSVETKPRVQPVQLIEVSSQLIQQCGM